MKVTLLLEYCGPLQELELGTIYPSRHPSMSLSASSVLLPWPSMSFNDIFVRLLAVILLKKDRICSLLKYSAGENNFCWSAPLACHIMPATVVASFFFRFFFFLIHVNKEADLLFKESGILPFFLNAHSHCLSIFQRLHTSSISSWCWCAIISNAWGQVVTLSYLGVLQLLVNSIFTLSDVLWISSGFEK